MNEKYMDLKLEVEEKFIHLVVKGYDTYENSLSMWKQVVELCNKENKFYVFGESYRINPVSVLENMSTYEIFKKAKVTNKFKIAWVDHNPKTYDSTRVAETALINRGISYARLFRTKEEALNWLLGE